MEGSLRGEASEIKINVETGLTEITKIYWKLHVLNSKSDYQTLLIFLSVYKDVIFIRKYQPLDGADKRKFK